MLCAWSLGTLMSDDRSAANRIGGFLLHLTFERNPADTVEITRVTYTPTYVWKYRQDNQYYYKCLAADRTPPDGMDNEQMGVMNRSLEAVQKALEDSPAVLR